MIEKKHDAELEDVELREARTAAEYIKTIGAEVAFSVGVPEPMEGDDADQNPIIIAGTGWAEATGEEPVRVVLPIGKNDVADLIRALKAGAKRAWGIEL